jgi:uncharacterized protein (TIGR02246 family)
MAEEQPDRDTRSKLGRTIALTGVVFVISLAVLSMTLLALSLLPQIFPTLVPSNGMFDTPLISMAEAKPASQNMSRSEIESAIGTARNAWVTGDADAFANLFTENGEFVIPGQTYRGTEAIRSIIAEFSETHTNVQIDIQRIIIDDNQAVVEWHWQDTDETGKQTIAEDAIVIDFEGTQISRWREYIDEATPRNI